MCALCKLGNPTSNYELAKLAMTSNIQGKGIGRILCDVAINKAKELGEYHPSYARSDIQWN